VVDSCRPTHKPGSPAALNSHSLGSEMAGKLRKRRATPATHAAVLYNHVRLCPSCQTTSSFRGEWGGDRSLCRQLVALKFTSRDGGAENAGRENDGREIDGPICRA